MYKILLFILFQLNIILLTSVSGQPEPEIVRFDYPKYIPINNQFNVSAVIKLEDNFNKTVVTKLQKLREVKVNSVYLYFGKNKNQLIGFKSTLNEIAIYFNPDNIELFPGKLHQLIFECTVTSPIKSNQKIIYESRLTEDVNEMSLTSEEDIFIFQSYVPQETAGKALQIIDNSKLNIKFNGEKEFESILFEFWLKSNTDLNNFINILDRSSTDSLLSLSINEFGFLTFDENTFESPALDSYLDKGAWNYFQIFITDKFGEVSITTHVNSELVHSCNLDNFNGISNIAFNISGAGKDKYFEIDRLKIWEYENSLQLAAREKHFQVYDADSSRLIYSSNFENTNEFKNIIVLDDITIDSGNLNFHTSNAPIFSKAPKLNVTMGNSYNSIVWYVQEYSFAEAFILEKSIKGQGFIEVYKTLADDDPLKIYYYTDEILEENEVAYYRVRQVNKDGSEVSSAEVKIGQIDVAEFNLSQNYPNPFNPITSIFVEVMVSTNIEIKVYDLVGNNVENLFDGTLPQGLHTFEFNGSSLPSGIYFYEVISPNSQVVRKMILAK